MGFLRFCLLCLDFLAWPTFALIYPLWASIRAIETSSKYNMKKLVTYWTIFSLICLFEIFFVKLIERVPFWPYIKLITICWLVIPQFNGASHVYQCLIHPCLSIDPLDIVNRFSIPKEKSYSEDSFLASAETYLKENGPEALEKLIAIKKKHIEHILPDADALEVVKTVEPTEKNVTTEEKLVEHPKLHLVESEKKEVATPEIQRVTTPAQSKETRPLEIHDLRKVQREWTCPVCQLTTTSEATLNSHLLGEKHRSNCEKLKTSKQTTKNMQSSATKDKSNSEELKTSRQTSKDSNSSATKAYESCRAKNSLKIYLPVERTKQNTTEKPMNTHIDSNSSATKAYDSSRAKNSLKIYLPVERTKQNTTEKPMNTHIDEASGQQMKEKPKKTNASVEELPKFCCQPKLWCGICNITCRGKIDMDSHLKGRKHLFNMQIISSGW